LKGGFLQLEVEPPCEDFPADFKIDGSSDAFGDNEDRLACIIRQFKEIA
jgi:hypothetical protein